MGASLTLGRVKGIKIRVHWTFYLLLAWIVFLEISRGSSLESMLWSVAFILVLFACVVLHELGHSLTALRFGVNTRQITLLPIGGVASLEKMPEDPREELLVALAGPAVNVVIAAVLWLILPVQAFFSQEPEALQEALSVINAGNFLYLLLSANLLLVAFNMIPAFPMDGGRVLRALLAMRMDRVSATRAAALLGQGLAVLFFLVGILYNPILALIAVFIYFGARSESAMEQQMVVLRGRTVREAMMTDVTLVDPESSLGDVIDLILDGTERDFVVSGGRQVEGVLYETDLIRAWRSRGAETLVREVMVSGVQAVSAGDPLKEVIGKLQEGRSFLPVVEDGRPVGAIDMNNLSEFIVFRAASSAR